MIDIVKLFKKLINRNINGLILRLMLFIYKNQYCNVQWNNITSDDFTITNGVKQDAILSPIFFSLYIKDLIILLEKDKIGC